MKLGVLLIVGKESRNRMRAPDDSVRGLAYLQRCRNRSPRSSPPSNHWPGRTILQIVPDLQSGGAERATVDVAEALSRVGARCLVASRGGRMVSELQSKGGVWAPFPAATKNPFAMALNSVQLARIIRDEGVDIVHARSRAPAWVAYYAARLTGAKLVTTYHSAYGGSSVIKQRYNAIMAAGDAVIAISEFAAQRIRDLHPESASRIVIVPRGADLRVFSPSAVGQRRVERLRAEWGVAPYDRVVLLPSRLSARKGHAVLLEAAKRLIKEGFLDLRVVFVGDPHSDAFRARPRDADRARRTSRRRPPRRLLRRYARRLSRRRRHRRAGDGAGGFRAGRRRGAGDGRAGDHLGHRRRAGNRSGAAADPAPSRDGMADAARRSGRAWPKPSPRR